MSEGNKKSLNPEERTARSGGRSPIDVFSMGDFHQLYGSAVQEAKQHAPVERDAKRKQSDERLGEVFGVQQRIIRVFSQAFYECSEFTLLCFRQMTCAFNKAPMIDDFKHCLTRALSKMPRHQKTAESGVRAQLSVPCEQTQVGTLPLGLFRPNSLRASVAFPLLHSKISCSYSIWRIYHSAGKVKRKKSAR